MLAASSQSAIDARTHRAADLPASSQEPEVTATCTDTVAALNCATLAITGAPAILLEELVDEHQPTLHVATQYFIFLTQTLRTPGSQQGIAAGQLAQLLACCIHKQLA